MGRMMGALHGGGHHHDHHHQTKAMKRACYADAMAHCSDKWVDGVATLHSCLLAHNSALSAKCAEKLPTTLPARAAMKGIGEHRPKWLSHLWSYSKVEFTTGAAKGTTGFVATRSALDLTTLGPAVVRPPGCNVAIASLTGKGAAAAASAATLGKECTATLTAPIVVWPSLTPRFAGGVELTIVPAAGDELVLLDVGTKFIPALGGKHHHHHWHHGGGKWDGDKHHGGEGGSRQHHGHHHHGHHHHGPPPPSSSSSNSIIGGGGGGEFNGYELDREEVDGFELMGHLLGMLFLCIVGCCCGTLCTTCKLRRRYASRIAELESAVHEDEVSRAIAASLVSAGAPLLPITVGRSNANAVVVGAAVDKRQN